MSGKGKKNAAPKASGSDGAKKSSGKSGGSGGTSVKVRHILCEKHVSLALISF